MIDGIIEGKWPKLKSLHVGHSWLGSLTPEKFALLVAAVPGLESLAINDSLWKMNHWDAPGRCMEELCKFNSLRHVEVTLHGSDGFQLTALARLSLLSHLSVMIPDGMFGSPLLNTEPVFLAISRLSTLRHLHVKHFAEQSNVATGTLDRFFSSIRSSQLQHMQLVGLRNLNDDHMEMIAQRLPNLVTLSLHRFTDISDTVMFSFL